MVGMVASTRLRDRITSRPVGESTTANTTGPRSMAFATAPGFRAACDPIPTLSTAVTSSSRSRSTLGHDQSDGMRGSLRSLAGRERCRLRDTPPKVSLVCVGAQRLMIQARGRRDRRRTAAPKAPIGTTPASARASPGIARTRRTISSGLLRCSRNGNSSSEPSSASSTAVAARSTRPTVDQGGTPGRRIPQSRSPAGRRRMRREVVGFGDHTAQDMRL